MSERAGSLDQGAENAVEVCMGLKANEKVLIVCDRSSLSVGNALKDSAEKISTPSRVQLFVLEDLTSRPMVELPAPIEKAIPGTDVAFWAAGSLPGELPVRGKFRGLAAKYARLGHMPNITEKLMEEGMCANYDEVYDLTHKIYDLAKNSKVIQVGNEEGVEIEAEFDPSWRFQATAGTMTRGVGGIFPKERRSRHRKK
jgi:aminopeptidase